MTPLGLRGIYVIVDTAYGDPLAQLLAIRASGVAIVQLRAKTGVRAELARAMGEVCRDAGIGFVVNDDPAVARLAPEFGLHVGQEDLAALGGEAVREFARERPVGLSCASIAEVRVAEELGAAYVGVGPFAETATKADAGPPIAAGRIAEIARATTLPVVAIGGITRATLAAVARTGASMAAVGRAIALADDPAKEAARFVVAWDEATT